MKQSIRRALGAICLLLATVCFAANAQQIVYSNANNVNVRKSASTNAPVVDKLGKYQIVNLDMDAAPAEGWTAIHNNYEYNKNGYVKSTLLTSLPTTAFTPTGDEITFSLMEADADAAGYLILTRTDNGYEGEYRLISREMQRMGGSGTLLYQTFTATVINGQLYYTPGDGMYGERDDAQMHAPFNAEKGILSLDDILWRLDK